MPSIKPKNAISTVDVLTSSASGRIILLKLVDRIAGFFIILFIRGLLLFKSKETPAIPKKIKHVLLIRPGGIGDAVCLLPLIRALKQKIGCSIDVLCERRNIAVFDFCREDLRHIWAYDIEGFSLIKHLTAQNYDCVIDTEQYHNFSAIFAWGASHKCRVGFDTVSYRSKMYTHTVPYSHQAQEYKMFLDLFNVITPITVEEYLQHKRIDCHPKEFCHPERSEGSQSDQDSSPFGLRMTDLKVHKYISVYIGASVPERYWGSDKFAQLCEAIAALGHRIVLVGGKEDLKKAAEIKLLFNNDKIINLVGKISLEQTAAVLKDGIAAVGADSGIMHLACAVDCPALWLFGAGIEKKWLPEFSRHESFNLHLPCSPCTLFGYTPRCPYDVRCLKEISVAQVVNKIRVLIKGPSHGPL